MKTEVVVYRIITILLLPVGVLFGFSTLFGLLSVVANPPTIIGILPVASIVFYIISSTVFLSKSITNAKPCKPSLKTSMQISGIISAVFSIFLVLIHVFFVNDPSIVNILAAQMIKQPGMPANITLNLLTESLKTLFTFFMVIGLVLILHIIMSFRLLKQFSFLFKA